MELSKRLKAAASMVKECHILADIGTDHGYVPIFLFLQGSIQHAIACDVKKGPLKKAMENILFYHAEQGVETRLGNGLEPLTCGEADTVFIAGMGGMLMIDILSRFPKTTASFRQMILQPQLDVEHVRRFLHLIHFQIAEENFVLEDGKFYPILRAVPGKERYEKEEEYQFGRLLLQQKHPVLKQYLLFCIKQQEQILNNLETIKTQSAQKRVQQLKQENNRYKEVLSWLL